MDSHQHSDELELRIIKELNSIYPHRKVIIQVGKNFFRKDLAERFTAYGEVRMGCHTHGSFCDEQLKLREAFHKSLGIGRFDPPERETRRQLFNNDLDNTLNITVTEHGKVAGSICLILWETWMGNRKSMDDKIRLPFLNDEQKREWEAFNSLDDDLTKKCSAKQKIQKAWAWLIFTVTQIISNVAYIGGGDSFIICSCYTILRKAGAEQVAEIESTEFKGLSTEPTQFTKCGFRLEFSKRELYYYHYLTMMKIPSIEELLAELRIRSNQSMIDLRAHQHSDDLELKIDTEINRLFPHRKVIIQIGKHFSRKDIAQRFIPYGEVRMGCHKSGRFYEQQFELDEILETNLMHVLPYDQQRARKVFDRFLDSVLQITIIEHNKVAGMIFLIIHDDLNIARGKSYREEQLKTVTDDQKNNCNALWKAEDEMRHELEQKVRSRPQVQSGRYIVHPDFRRLGVGLHLQLLRIMFNWFISPESIAISRLPPTIGILQKIGAEVVGKQEIPDQLDNLLPATENPRPPVHLFYFQYSQREIYYKNILDMMRSSLKHHKSRL